LDTSSTTSIVPQIFHTRNNIMFSSQSKPRNPPASQQQEENDVSLTTLLPTPRERASLALLILLSTDAQKKDITEVYEAPPEPANLPTPQPRIVDDLISFEEPSTLPPPNAAAGSTPTPTPFQHSVLVRQHRLRVQQLADSKLQGLRRAALTHFEAWRARVLRRVCEALSVTPEAVRRARKEFAERRLREGREREEKEFRDWAHGLGDEDDGAEEVEEVGKRKYEKISTRLMELDAEKRVKVLNCCLLLLLSLEEYSSLSRILLVRLASSLHISRSSLVELENKIAAGLLRAASHLSASEHAQKEAQANAASRRWKVGLATVAGAALIGVTGGLAAPLLAAGLGSVFGAIGLGAVSGLLGALAGNVVLIGGLFGAYGAKMTGKMVEELARDIEDFKFLPLQTHHDEQDHQDTTANEKAIPVDESHKLRVAIGIPGYLTKTKDIMHPAYVIASPGTETFALQWEVEVLLRLGLSLSSVLKSYIWDVAKFEILRRTLLGVLAAGLWPLGLLRMARVIDNPFNIARIRADKAGKVLAHALIAKCAGNRPVTLVGVSLGARVVYACLQELAAQNVFGIVENAVLLGAPVSSDGAAWIRMRTVVAGRLVNVFSDKDVILGFVYRASAAQFNIAGLQAVDEVHGLENVNVSDIVDGHTKYRYSTGRILTMIGFEDVSSDGVQREARALKALEAGEKNAVKKETDSKKEAIMIKRTVEMKLGEKIPQVKEKPHNEGVHGLRNKQNILSEKAPESNIEESNAARKLVLLQIAEDNEKMSKGNLDLLPEVIDAPRTVTHSKIQDNQKTVELAESDPLEVLTINAKSTTDIQVEDIGSDTNSEIIEVAELTYLDPEPIESDDEEEVNFGDPNSGFKMTWNQNS
jgi:hypothetical protein